MDEDNRRENPSGIVSFHHNKTHDMYALCLNKKRKQEAEQTGSPASKQKCFDNCLHPETLRELETSPEVEDFAANITKQNAEVHTTIHEELDIESEKDSNSFNEHCNSAMSIYDDGKFGTEVSKIWPHDRPSTSSFRWGHRSSKDLSCSSDSLTSRRVTGKEISVDNEVYHCYDALKLPLNLEEPFLEFESHLGHRCAKYGNESIDPCLDKEYQDTLFPSGVNSNTYVLSSGRWSIGQDTQPDTRKPTIDQEFEEYFSTLML